MADWSRPDGGESWYSPRLLLSLISELSYDSRFRAAHRSGDKTEMEEWKMWSSRTFASQATAGIYNWTQIHALGALEFQGAQPKYTPLSDPGAAAKSRKPPSITEIFNHWNGG